MFSALASPVLYYPVVLSQQVPSIRSIDEFQLCLGLSVLCGMCSFNIFPFSQKYNGVCHAVFSVSNKCSEWEEAGLQISCEFGLAVFCDHKNVNRLDNFWLRA